MNWENCRFDNCCLNFCLRHNFTFIFCNFQKYRSKILQIFNKKKYNFESFFVKNPQNQLVQTLWLNRCFIRPIYDTSVGIDENGHLVTFFFYF